MNEPTYSVTTTTAPPAPVMLTAEFVKEVLQACYSMERLKLLFPLPRTLKEVLTLKEGPWADVPADDRWWMATEWRCYNHHQQWNFLMLMEEEYNRLKSIEVCEIDRNGFTMAMKSFRSMLDRFKSDLLVHEDDIYGLCWRSSVMWRTACRRRANSSLYHQEVEQRFIDLVVERIL